MIGIMRDKAKEKHYPKNSTSSFFSTTSELTSEVKINPALKERGIMRDKESCESVKDAFTLSAIAKIVKQASLNDEEKERLFLQMAMDSVTRKLHAKAHMPFVSKFVFDPKGEKLDRLNPDCFQACKFGINKQFALNPGIQKTNSKSRKTLLDKFPQLSTFTDNWLFYKNILAETYRIIVQDMGFLSVVSNGETYFVPVYEKGSPAYNRQKRWEYSVKGRMFAKDYPYTHLQTLTLDSSKFSADIIEATKKFVEEAANYIKSVHRRFDCKHIYAVEFQERGAIHFHIVWFFKEPMYKKEDLRKRKKKKGWYIAKGKWRPINDEWKWGHADSSPLGTQEAVSYATKYLNKGTEEDFWKLANKEDFSPTEIKDIMGFLMPKICNFKQISSSHLSEEEQKRFEKQLQIDMAAWKAKKEMRKSFNEGLKQKFKPAPKKNKPKVFSQNREVTKIQQKLLKTLEFMQVPTREASLLEYIRTNRNKGCLKWLYSGKLRNICDKYGVDFRKLNTLPEETKKEILKKCRPVGCGVCLAGLALQDIVFGTNQVFEQFDNFEYLRPFFIAWLSSLGSMPMHFETLAPSPEKWDGLCRDFICSLLCDLGFVRFVDHSINSKKKIGGSYVATEKTILENMENLQMLLNYRPQLAFAKNDPILNKACGTFFRLFDVKDRQAAECLNGWYYDICERLHSWLKENGFIYASAPCRAYGSVL